MRRWIALCVVAGLCFGVGCSRKSDGSSARLTVDGQAEVASPNEPWKPFTGERRLGVDDQVRILAGSGTIALSDDREFELREGSEVGLVSVGEGQLGADLRAGQLLVVAPDKEAVVTSDEGTVQVEGGAARLTRAVVVASYTADVRLETGGQRVIIRPLRQVGLPAAGLPSPPKPIAYSIDDPWDQRFLGEVPQLHSELLARSLGFTAQMPASQPQTPEFFKQVLPQLANEPLDARVARPRFAGESLVGLAIALNGQGGTFAERWDEVIAFRDAGADWGLVAVDQGASRVSLLNDIDTAIGVGLNVFLPPAAPPAVPPPSGNPAASVSAPSSGGTTTAAAPAPTPSRPTSGAPPAAENGRDGPLNTGIAPIDSAANSLVDLLSGLLNSLGK